MISPLSRPTIDQSDVTIKELMCLFENTIDPEKKDRIKQAIMVIVEIRERSAFMARFVLKDFGSWNQVLTKQESDVENAHKAEFYEPHLLEVLSDGKLAPIAAIQQVLARVIHELTLADFAITASKRFRYDTTIRFLANDLKKRGILSKEKEIKNKYWMLKTS